MEGEMRVDIIFLYRRLIFFARLYDTVTRDLLIKVKSS